MAPARGEDLLQTGIDQGQLLEIDHRFLINDKMVIETESILQAFHRRF
jgi:hypothetical protein